MLSFLALAFGLFNAAHSYILSGYICPTCPSAPDPVSLIANINSAYNHVSIAFIVWNADGSIVNQFDDPSKSFTLTKQMVEGLQSKGVTVLISIGGGAGSTLECSKNSDSAFMDNMAKGIMDITDEYGFDGVDFDIEHRSGDYVLCAELIATVMNRLHAHKLKVSMAPQVCALSLSL